MTRLHRLSESARSQQWQNLRPGTSLAVTLAVVLTVGLGIGLLITTTKTYAIQVTAGQLELHVVDQATGQPVACRMHLKNARGRTVKPPRAVAWGDHFVIDGSITLRLPKGNYTFEVERGLEYLHHTGHFTIENFADDTKTIELRRFVDMKKEGWWSGDLHVQRPLKEAETILQSEDLHFVPWSSITAKANPWGRQSKTANPLQAMPDQRFVQLYGITLAEQGNALSAFNLQQPLELTRSTCLGEAELKLLSSSNTGSNAGTGTGDSDARLWFDVATPWSWDLPLWLSQGRVDSIQILNDAVQRDGASTKFAGYAPPRDAGYRGASGPGLWGQQIYYHVLNCGFKIPPSAGSGSGDGQNPAGFNRVYVQVGDQTLDSFAPWWQAFRAGNVMVTNGPMLRAFVSGNDSEHRFVTEGTNPYEVELGLTLSTRDSIEQIEIVQNGTVLHQVKLNELKERRGMLPSLQFTESGWFVIRATTTHTDRYRMASTAPYYVDFAHRPRISKASVKFFQDWTSQRITMLEKQADRCADQLAAWQGAQEFWQKLADAATAE